MVLHYRRWYLDVNIPLFTVFHCRRAVELLQVGVVLGLGADGGGGTVAVVDDGFGREGQEFGTDAGDQLAKVAAGEIRAADGAGKESVADEDGFFLGAVKADAAGGVAGGVQDPQRDAGGLDEVAFFENAVGGGRFKRIAEHQRKVGLRIDEHIGVSAVDRDRDAGPCAAEGFDAGDVVDVAVREDDDLRAKVLPLEETHQHLGAEARIDYRAVGLLGRGTHAVTIGPEISQRQTIHLHVVLQCGQL
jgi:hypothetical protein